MKRIKKLLAVMVTLNLILWLPSKAASTDTETVNISKKELLVLREMASTQLSMLQRIRNLEEAYKAVQEIIANIHGVIDTIKSSLGLSSSTSETRNDDNLTGSFEHISGVIMSPGAVAFTVSTREGQRFDELGMDTIEMDVYFNQTLFEIDHIWGTGVDGNQYKEISLPADSRTSKDRISLPISDILANSVKFYIFLAPVDPLQIKVGDSTKIDIRYYKRTEKVGGVDVPPPLVYQRVVTGPDHITVTVK